MTFAAGDDLVQEFAFIRTPGGSRDPSGGVHVQEESQATERNAACIASGCGRGRYRCRRGVRCRFIRSRLRPRKKVLYVHARFARVGGVAETVRYPHSGDGVDQRVLDSALPDSRNTGLRSVSGECAIRQERTGSEDRCFGLPVDSISALSGLAARQLSAARYNLRDPLSLETSRQPHSNGGSACDAHTKIARPDESAASPCAERNHWLEWATHFGCDPGR